MEKEYLRFIAELKRKEESKNKDIIFLCIGSNKIIGDSFGPKVGSKLKEMEFNKKIKLIGDMKKPITAKNVKNILKKIDKRSYIIAIDSALSNLVENEVFITKDQISLGSGIGKQIDTIGNLGIKLNVAKHKNNFIENIKSLKMINEYKLNKLSSMVSQGIYEVFGN